MQSNSGGVFIATVLLIVVAYTYYAALFHPTQTVSRTIGLALHDWPPLWLFLGFGFCALCWHFFESGRP